MSPYSIGGLPYGIDAKDPTHPEQISFPQVGIPTPLRPTIVPATSTVVEYDIFAVGVNEKVMVSEAPAPSTSHAF